MSSPSKRLSAYFCANCAVLLTCIVGCSKTSPPESTVEWIDPNEIQRGPVVHDKLPDELMARIKNVHATFAEVDGTTLESWVDDFQRDLDPEGNIEIWEDMQIAYNSHCNERDLSLDAKKEVYKIVLMRSMMPDDDVLSRLEPKHLTPEDVRTILAAYPGEAKPIDVIRSNE